MDGTRFEVDRAVRTALETNQRPQRRCLARRVGTYQRRDLSLLDVEAHVVQDVDLPVVHVDAAKLEHADGQDKLR